MKVSLLRTKTISAATAVALDDAVAAFVQSLKEEQMLATHFHFVTGEYVVVIIYSQ